ncbi:MAG: ABC transporter ATP-binding protein [Bacteroidia bacterium]
MKTNIKELKMIQFTNVFASYSGGNVLIDVSASFDMGLHYLVGLNGSGKSSLLKAILNLLPYQGEIQIATKDIQQISRREMAKCIAFVPQQLTVNFPINVHDFLRTGRFPYTDFWGNYRKEDELIVEKYIEKLALGDFLKRNLSEVSGGELQRIYLARALAQETSIILLDEPAQSLDPKSKEFLYEYLFSLAQTHTILCTTHDLFPLENEKIWVCGIKKGKILLHERGGDVRTRLFEEIYVL